MNYVYVIKGKVLNLLNIFVLFNKCVIMLKIVVIVWEIKELTVDFRRLIDILIRSIYF